MSTAKRIPSPRGRAHLDVLSLAGSDLHEAIASLHEAYGPAFAFGFGPIRFTWFVGRDAIKEVFHEKRDAFSQQGGYDFLKPVGGSTALINSDEPEHMQRRRSVQPAFHGGEVQQWLRHGERELLPWLDAIAAKGETTDLYRGLRPRLVRVVAAIVLGDSPLARDEDWLQDVDALMDFPGRPMLEQQWKVPVPGSPWARFVAARRRVDSKLYAEIASRREGHFKSSRDVLNLLLERGNHATASPLSDKELRDQTLSLISAGFDTTSAALTWAVAMAVENPDARERLASELAHGDPVEAQRAPFTDAFVKETLRLRPPAAAALRRTVRPVEIAGFSVPKNTRIAVSILETQRDPVWFEDPLRFEPERFLRGTPDPFAYVPFGYGARHCIGAGTATALIKLGLTLIFSRYEVASEDSARYRPVGMTLHPDGGLPIRLTHA